MQDRRPWAIEEVLKICRGLLDGSIPLIDGCRQLASLQYEIDGSQSADFDTFVAVDSETDDLPLGDVRQHCSPEWLKKTDAEIARAERLYREPVRKAAEALLLKLSTEAGNG